LLFLFAIAVFLQSKFCLVSFYASHARNAKEKRQREREISSLFESEEEYFGEVQRSGRTSNTPRSPFFFARCFLWSTALFLGAKGRRREREREIFRLSHVEKDTFFLLREIFSRY